MTIQETKKLCIIGAGASGLVMGAKLIESGIDFTIFEQSNELVVLICVSAVYPTLTTNLPAELMAFRDFDFPKSTPMFPSHRSVFQYLKDYAAFKSVYQKIQLNTQVISVVLDPVGQVDSWVVTIMEPQHSTTKTLRFDGVIICNGHFAYPNIPTINGIKDFPKPISHSQTYRHPENYKDKNVLVLGASYSGRDIVRELSSVCKKVYLCIRQDEKRTIPTRCNENTITLLPEIIDFHGNGMIECKDGSIIDDVDEIIFATGYLYKYPFMEYRYGIKGNGETTDGMNVHDLHLHLMDIDHPTLSFMGLPRSVVPFHLFEYQAEFLTAFFLEKLKLPSKLEMKRIALDGITGFTPSSSSSIHQFGNPNEFTYCDYLASLYGGPTVPQWRRSLRDNLVSLYNKFHGIE
ncbi:hypothetical protein HDV02_002712 [Globomyces sp. JEL0801]|nr:hypothetical protein HDV02_002712 [Globomyces sp. JEL0801]